MEYREAVERLERRKSKPGDFGFNAYLAEVEDRGHPQDCDVIHVAGTNGKGSTCHLLSGMLQEAGYTVGMFTGPHLGSQRERIQVDEEWISADAFVDRFETVQDADFSKFECMVYMALDHFARQDVDIAIMETGLGGRRDATNIVDPAAAVITNVTRDHTGVLGETVPEIAREKAGIIAENAPVVSGAEPPALDVIRDETRQVGTSLSTPDRHVSVADTAPLQLSFQEQTVSSSLRGRYQVDNINLCIETVEQLPYHVTGDDITAALRTVKIPGRMEPVATEPLTILDGAHNRAGVNAVVRSVDDVDIVVFGCLKTKPYTDMLEMLAETADRFVYTAPAKDDAADPETLQAVQDGVVVDEPVDAVETARRQSDGTVFVTGSLYLLREVRTTFVESADRTDSSTAL